MTQCNKKLLSWAIGLIVLQILDALFTCWGISRFGPEVEGNPLVKYLAITYGAEIALCSVKLVGILACIFLYWAKARTSLIFLTGLYTGVVFIWFRFWLHVMIGA